MQPGGTPILMGDMESHRLLGELAVGDVVVGFTHGRVGEARFFRPCRVLGHGSSNQELYEHHLESGGVVICTASHEWYRPKSREARPGRGTCFRRQYRPIKLEGDYGTNTIRRVVKAQPGSSPFRRDKIVKTSYYGATKAYWLETESGNHVSGGYASRGEESSDEQRP